MFIRRGARQALFTACLLGALATGQAAALSLPEGSNITATLTSGPATGLLSLADGYTASTNPSTAGISYAFGDLEFMTNDFALAFDWTSTGLLTVFNNSGAALTGNYTVSFSFASPVAGMTNLSGTGLTVGLVGNVLTMTVHASAFPSDFSPVDAAQITAVPEPAAWALMLGGLATVAATRRRMAKAAAEDRRSND